MIAVIALTTSSATARMGWTKEQCDSRYGAGTKAMNQKGSKYSEVYSYYVDNTTIKCTFYLRSSKCIGVVYSRKKPFGSNYAHKLIRLNTRQWGSRPKDVEQTSPVHKLSGHTVDNSMIYEVFNQWKSMRFTDLPAFGKLLDDIYGKDDE